VPLNRTALGGALLREIFGRSSSPCGAKPAFPYIFGAGQIELHIQWLGPYGQAIRVSLHKEDMPCELSI
jgi:hypothetical protein